MEGRRGVLRSITNALDHFIQERKLAVDQVQEKYLKHPLTQVWLEQHPQWNESKLLPYTNQISEYVREQEHCAACKGLDQCRNLIKGHFAQLTAYGNQVDVHYSPCSYYQRDLAEKQRTRLVRSHHIPVDIVKGSLSAFDHHEHGRMDAFAAVLQFSKAVEPGKDPMGLYLYGPLGVGKSYLLGAACNKLAERGIASYMVYSPDFFREIKSAIADQTLEEKLNALMEIPVLVFDDIGAENLSAWARDEVLGAILQYRVMKKKPTLYTSNYDYDQLEEHLAYSQKGGIEQLKAKRIMERIRHYTDAYYVDGRNRRKRNNF
jgi:primosomal protein DnaI